MSTPLLIELLQKMLTLHQSLYQIAQEKTVVIQNEDIKGLQRLMQEEQKHISAIQVVENQRKTIVEKIKSNFSIGMEELTISTLVQYLNVPEKEEIRQLQDKLIEQIDDLKHVNVLNQQLLMLSLQFVNLNIDLLAPETDSPNYSRTQEDDNIQPGRSLFDSQA